MTNIFFTSDHHFGHFNIIKYTGRPYTSLSQMNDELIQRWNSKISKNDIVFHLGDVFFKDGINVLKQLNGNIILISGNHDRCEHDHLYSCCIPELKLKIGNYNCFLVHVPIIDDPYNKRKPNFSLLNKFDYIICGHVHEKWKTNGKHINVGVDVWDFYPVHIDELIEFLTIRKE